MHKSSMFGLRIATSAASGIHNAYLLPSSPMTHMDAFQSFPFPISPSMSFETKASSTTISSTTGPSSWNSRSTETRSPASTSLCSKIVAASVHSPIYFTLMDESERCDPQVVTVTKEVYRGQPNTPSLVVSPSQILQAYFDWSPQEGVVKKGE